MNSPSLPGRLIAAAALLLAASTSNAPAQATLRSYDAKIIAKAQPDEWWFSFYDPDTPGSGENLYVKDGINLEDGLPGLPKTNQVYVWGMTRKDNYLWWGTGANVSTLVSSTYLDINNPSFSRSRSRDINYKVAEYGLSKFARDGVFDGETQMGAPISSAYGDWRPPDIFRYNLDTDEIERLDLNMRTSDPAAWALLWRCLGLRSAGYTPSTPGFPDGLVILAGPARPSDPGEENEGIIMFAFDAATGGIVAAKPFPEYNNIRKWTFFNEQAYTTVARSSGGGEVLRWSKETATPANPLVFETVGNLNAGGAELEIHDDGDGPRLFVTTWPNLNSDAGGGGLLGGLNELTDLLNAPAGLWRSPVIPANGLRSFNANQWNLVWSVTDYEPDLILAMAYGGGALASFDGYLYWGTMHVPGTSSLIHDTFYGTPRPLVPRPDPYPEDPEDPARVAYEADQERLDDEEDDDFQYSYRAISLWRGRNFTNTGGEIDLLYGNAQMPVRLPRSQFTYGNDPSGDLNTSWQYFLITRLGSMRFVEDGERVPFGLFAFLGQTAVLEDGGDWDFVPNARGYAPLYGGEGAGDYYNNYTWVMQVLNGKLYVGTMDWDDINTPDFRDGADILCFPSSTQPAVAISRRGMANWSSYGVRTIAADENRGELYLGMANVCNLLLDEDYYGEPVSGGWEVQRVKMRFPDEDFDELDDDFENEFFGSTTAVNDADGNEDGDPNSNWDEWLAGTPPNDPTSWFFSRVGPSGTPGLHQISWPGVAGRYYTVHASSTLDGDWMPVANYEGAEGTMTHTYDPSGSTRKFFKVEVLLEQPPAIEIE
ncbi:hypothetical protein [Haloferula sp. A504]|uniref:hypothetical protein n=1 Tax=Haloferula sp. A504 TaxID=3373601 RepID=UPI0031C48B9A|nr:hypothetical protein [Verrucomicrobiaceae bacterium E54]